jgi:hypothetical protein
MNFKFSVVIIVVLSFTCCNNDNSDIDCSLVDCAAQSFTIELIDSEGLNLIANGTYSKDEITVQKGSNDLTLNFIEADFIFFYPSGEEGNNSYEIKLNASETDILILDLSKMGSGNECCGPFFRINSALFNGVEQEVFEDDISSFEKIVVVKS